MLKTKQGSSRGSWEIAEGSLPEGLTLDAATGKISGTPAAISSQYKNYSFKAKFTNSFGSDIREVYLTVRKLNSLKEAKVGEAYSQGMSAGTTDPAVWSIDSGSLPEGLSINAVDGTISGTPTKAGSYDFVVKIKTDKGAGYIGCTINVTAEDAPEIMTKVLPNGTAGKAYSADLELKEGSGTGTWSVSSGQLPEGLALDSATGRISGTPAKEETCGFTVQFTNDKGTATKDLTIKISAEGTVQTLDPAAKYAHYSETIKQSPGTKSGTWSVAAGALPKGLSLTQEDGGLKAVISGTPEEAGDFAFTLKFRNEDGSAAYDYTLTVSDASVYDIDGYKIGHAIGDITIDLPGITGTWTASGGNGLPPGLSIADADGGAKGVISGTPSQDGKYQFLVKVTNASGEWSGRECSITVGPAIGTESLPEAAAGKDYSAMLEAKEGSTAGVWEIAEGNLPSGLTLDPMTGIISGRSAAETGTASFKVKFTNKYGSDEKTLTIRTINAPEKTLPGGKVGEAYNVRLTAGSSESGTWSVENGDLPEGLSLDASSGLIAGTPEKAGAYTFTVVFTTTGGKKGRLICHLSITGGFAPEIKTESLPGGRVGKEYSALLETKEGVSGGRWSVANGRLPDGLSLDPDKGTLTGTPSREGSYSFTVMYKNDGGQASRDYTVKIGPEAVKDKFPAGKVYNPYSGEVKLSTTKPGEWTLVKGTLPKGLSLIQGSDGITANIKGTPEEECHQNFTLRFKNADMDVSIEFSIDIDPAEVTDLAGGRVWTDYGTAKAGLDRAGTWTIEKGSLPKGMTFKASDDGSQCLISGTPEEDGEFIFLVKVTDSKGEWTKRFLKIVVQPAIESETLPAAKAGMNYEGTLKTKAGVSGGKWSVVEGALPEGLLLDASTGRISGKAVKNGKYSFKVRFTNAYGYDEKKISMEVKDTVVISLADGRVGSRYEMTLGTQGGEKGTWSIAAGSLPDGLTLDSETGKVSGTPTKEGTYDFTVTFKTDRGEGSADFSLRILAKDEPAIVIEKGSLEATSGVPIEYSFSLPEGVKPGLWDITAGTLPPGMTMDAKTGSITGTPEKPGTYTFTIKFANEDGVTMTTEMTIIVKSGAEEAEKKVSEQLMKTGDKKDPKHSGFSRLRLSNGTVKSRSIALKWAKVRGAKKYVVYGNKCGTKKRYAVLSRQSAAKLTVKKLANGAKLSPGKYHKFFVAAFSADGKLLAVSKSIHVKTNGGRLTNFKSVKITNVKHSKKTLKKGKKFKLRTKALKVSKKRKVQVHRKIAFESSNKKVATVSKSGVIKAKKKGTCYIYAYLQSGKCARVKVRVK